MASRRWRNLAIGAGAGLAAWQYTKRARSAPTPLPAGPTQRVLVLGAGFGGMAVLDSLYRRLGHQPRLEVLAVDRNNFNLFTPLLYQVATGLVDPDNITYPLRTRARSQAARFQESLVEAIDLDARQVLTDDSPLSYDYLRLHGQHHQLFYARCGRHATMALGDGLSLRNRIIDCFERAR